MRINHNIAALNTYRQLGINQVAGNKSLERLSSGLRINKAGDDAAGLAISEKMRGQIRGLDQAARNAQDGISLLQTAEGALSETHSILQRMKELATQAANDTNTVADRSEIQREINQLTTEINRIGATTEFNTKKLLDSSISIADKYSAYIQAGVELGAVTKIIDAATKASVLSSTLAGSINIHVATGASVTGGAGAPTLTDAGLVANNLVIDGANNELTFAVGGVTKHVVLAQATYNGVGGGSSANLLSDINAKLLAAGNLATASLDGGKLKLTSVATGSSSSVQILGSGAAAALFGANWSSDLVSTAGLDDNRSFTLDIGAENNVNVQLTAGTYTLADLATHVQTTINTATIGDDVAVTVEGNRLKIENTTAGSTHKLEDFQGAAAVTLGLTTGTLTAAQDANNVVRFDIDGEVDVDVTLSAGSYDRATLASVLQTKINQATLVAADVTVTVTSGNVLKITSGLEGAAGQLAFDDGAGAKTLGLVIASATNDGGSDGAAADLKMQIGANNGQTISISINDMRATALSVSGTAGAAQGVVTGASFTAANGVSNGVTNALSSAALDVSTVTKASAAIEVLDKAIGTVSAERSKIGAYTNRLEHTITNLGTSAENIVAAESRIRDVDMAKEIMEFTKMNILTQAAQAMLAQANQQPQGVLQLLR